MAGTFTSAQLEDSGSRRSGCSRMRRRSCLEEDLGDGRGLAALAHDVDAHVQVGLAGREPLGEREREAGLDQDVQAPALDLGLLALALAVSR